MYHNVIMYSKAGLTEQDPAHVKLRNKDLWLEIKMITAVTFQRMLALKLAALFQTLKQKLQITHTVFVPMVP